MEKQEAYSVLITGDKGSRGTGILFYLKNAASFYVLTCAHVIYTAETVSVHILLPTNGDPEEVVVRATREQFHFSPIDEPTIMGDQSTSTHTCDIAIIECGLGDFSLPPTQYSVYPMVSRERVRAIGYPAGKGSLYYQQDYLSATVEKVLDGQNYFLIRVAEPFLNAADREGEIQGFSGSPVWDEETLDEERYLFGGLIASGMGQNVSRGRIRVMNARYIQSLMYQEFGILMENRIPDVPETEVAPGYLEEMVQAEPLDHVRIRDSWVENERRKGQTYIDGLQLEKAIAVVQEAKKNTEFRKCTKEQKYEIYAVLLGAYRLAREFEQYDQIVEEMHQAGINSERENVIEAVRYFEALDNEKAMEFAQKALEQNPEGNEERVLMAVIQASADESAEISILSEFIGSNDQLLIKPQDEKEEEFLYQLLGFSFGNRFRETGRAIRCLNKAFQIGGNYIVLESLAVFYYLHSLRDAFIEEGKDRIDPFRIDQDAIDKARNAFLSVLTVADEMWLRGTIRRVGPLMFKCFYFMQDNFRIYKHYHDMMRYFEFPDQEMLRDIQICYLEVAIQKETVDLSEYKGLTEHDRKYFELIRLLSNPLMKFDRGMAVPAEISESDLLKVIGEGEKRLQVLMDTQTDERIGFDRLHQDFINLYGNGILRFHWKAISEVKRHAKAIVHPLEAESLEIYVRELEADDFAASEQEYIRYFEKHRDVISFNQLCHFYTRHGRIAKTKELYDNVFDEYRFLIENQSEYFYRVYISFYVENGFDLTAPIRCYVEHGDEIKDSYLKLFFETELDFATATFNNPDYMLDNARVLLEEGVIEKQDYNRRCLIINMLNCRPLEAEKFADSDHERNPYLASGYERMLFVWMRHPVVPNPHWNSMQSWSMEQLNQIYSEEPWHKPVQEILDACGMCSRRAIVVDLWAIYYLQKLQWPEFMNCFDKVYVTHDTVSMALQEIMEVNDDDIRGVLANFQNARNLIIQSPTIKDQLEIRSPKFKYMEIHQALLLAEILDCPAFVGEFRYPIPEHFRSRVIRPDELDDLYECMEVILMRK